MEILKIEAENHSGQLSMFSKDWDMEAAKIKKDASPIRETSFVCCSSSWT
jgi:hypothetical protein